MKCLLLLIVLSGCAVPAPVTAPVPKHVPDCVNDPFDYDFYSHNDQARLTYCYAVLQTIAKGKEAK
jgi:hypothetical protein